MSNQREEGGFFMFMPANVLHDENLSNSEKLFYLKISGLTKEKGYCWASNSYFAEEFDVNRSTVSRWIKALKENNHIRIEEVYENNKMTGRRIYVSISPYFHESNSPFKEDERGCKNATDRCKNATDRCKNENHNNKTNNKENREGTHTHARNGNLFEGGNDKYDIPSKKQVEAYFEKKGDMDEFDIPLEAENFINNYEEKEWKRNGKRIKYWKKLAATWNNRYKQYNHKNGNGNGRPKDNGYNSYNGNRKDEIHL